MKSVIQLLESIEASSGAGSKAEKFDVLSDNLKHPLLSRVFKAAQDPFIVYYITKFKVPKSTVTRDPEHSDDTVRSFLEETLPRLASREVTGNAAKKLVNDVFATMSPLEQKWCQRILLKNLRCGVSESTVNKAWPGLIPTFDVALAEKVKAEFVKGKGIVIKSKIVYPVRVEPKLDGLRCIAVRHEGKVTLYTRNGNEIETLPTIKAALEAHMPDETVFDGEAMGKDWNQSNSVIASTKNAKDDAGMFYNVFDSMTFDDWKEKTNETSLSDRVIETKLRLATFPEGSPVVQVYGIIANDERELLEFYQECLNRGFEGVMVKYLDFPYIFDRSHAVEKLKPVTTYEGVIVGHYLGRKGTKNEGRFGGFHLVLPNGVVTRVGGGYDDKDRAEIALAGPDSYIGRVMEIEAQPDPLTEDGLTVDGKARFPVHIRYREPGDVDRKVLDAGKAFLDANGPIIETESEDEDKS